jgi:hypothetical protein
MESPKVLYAERINNGVMIEFEDGRAALYPASLLDKDFSQAIQVENEELDPEED